MIWMKHKELRDNVDPELLDVYDRHKDEFFEIKDSPVTQTGKLKLEGLFDEAYVRCLKCYSLWSGDESLKRCKGISRRSTEKLARTDFHTDRLDDPEPKIANWKLGATRGLEMAMSVETRRLPQKVNYKRRCLVSENQMFLTRRMNDFSPLQSSHHSFPLA